MDTLDGGLNEAAPGRRFVDVLERVLTWVLGILCITVTVAILMPLFAQLDNRPSRTAIRAGVFNRAEKLGLGVLMYTNDYDGKLPIAASWMDGTSDYVGDEAIFHSPDLPKPSPDAYGFALRRRLAGRNPADEIQPDEAVMVFESIFLKRNTVSELWSLPKPGRAPGGYDAVVFLSGSAKMVQPGVSRKLR